MQLIKEGFGRAKGFADMADVSISLILKSKHKNDLLDLYLLDYEALKTHLDVFLKRYGLEMMFEDYKFSEKTKKVETTKFDMVETTYELDYYYICGNFSIEIPIKDNDRRIVAEFIDLIEKFDRIAQYHIEFVLSEKKLSELMAQATNNALDNIKIEVSQIADHLGLHNVSLASIDFRNNSRGYERMSMANSGYQPDERIKKLDDMLESREIEVVSRFTSEWEIA